LWGLVDQRRRVDPLTEQASFEARYLVIQPSLDESMFRLWGQLYGIDGQLVDKALREKAGTFPNLPDQTQGQLMADALASVCADSLTGGSEEHPGRAVTVAEVFVDAAMAAPTFGEAGVTTSGGLRVGPNTLSEILCEGRVRVIYADSGGPIAVTHLTEAIPPAVKAWVLHRDQGQCSIEGCRSRYRLQIHHIQERHLGGDHDPSNLITLCWYHHHIAIHQLGMTIDPNSPTHRRRLVGWRPTTGPPRPQPTTPSIANHLTTHFSPPSV
jgi:5-methylcytosine-specific restriction endonuclease McrA